jgi:hypothetical protein
MSGLSSATAPLGSNGAVPCRGQIAAGTLPGLPALSAKMGGALMRATLIRRRRRVRVLEVAIIKPAVETPPTVNDPVKSDLDPPKPRRQPQFGTKPQSPQMD